MYIVSGKSLLVRLTKHCMSANQTVIFFLKIVKKSLIIRLHHVSRLMIYTVCLLECFSPKVMFIISTYCKCEYEV